MKHVINSDTGEWVNVQTLPEAGCIAISTFNRNTARPDSVAQAVFLKPAQVGMLIASLQMCGEHVENWKGTNWKGTNWKGTQGVRCHGDACAAGQLECPTKAACGVAA